MKRNLGFKRNTKQFWDNMYMVMSILTIISAIIAIIFSGKNSITYAICFFSAALMQGCHGFKYLCFDEKYRRAYGWSILSFALALAFIALAIISIVVL